MDFTRLLRYVDAVARTGSIRAAAEKLNVVSSALNRRILDLEQELGTPLFERRPRGVVPTPAGQSYLRFVRQALSEHDAALSQIEELKGLRRGNIRVQAISAIAASELPTLITRFRAAHPRITFDVSIVGSEDVVAAVLNDDADCGVTFNPATRANFHQLAEARQQLCAVMRADHPLAKHSKLRLSDCSQYPIALADATWGGRQMLNEHLSASYVKLDAVLQTNSNEMLAGFVRQGMNIYFQIRFPDAERRFSADLVAIPLAQFEGSRRQMVLGVRRGRTLPVISAMFCEYLRTELFRTALAEE